MGVTQVVIDEAERKEHIQRISDLRGREENNVKKIAFCYLKLFFECNPVTSS
jgi:hypothetical protein